MASYNMENRSAVNAASPKQKNEREMVEKAWGNVPFTWYEGSKRKPINLSKKGSEILFNS